MSQLIWPICTKLTEFHGTFEWEKLSRNFNLLFSFHKRFSDFPFSLCLTFPIFLRLLRSWKLMFYISTSPVIEIFILQLCLNSHVLENWISRKKILSQEAASTSTHKSFEISFHTPWILRNWSTISKWHEIFCLQYQSLKICYFTSENPTLCKMMRRICRYKMFSQIIEIV